MISALAAMLVLSGLLGGGPSARGAVPSLGVILVAPESSRKAPVRAGAPARISVMLTNADTHCRAVPGEIILVLTGESGRELEAAARVKEGSPVKVLAGGFERLDYEFDLPRDMTGLVQARARGLDANTILFFAQAAAGPEAPAGADENQGDSVAKESADETANAPAEEAPVPEPVNSLMSKFQPFFVNFYPYKPVYFLFGADPGIQKTSFQISFKYKLFNFCRSEADAGLKNTLDKIYLAYTQQSFWDLKSDSAPFEDSRYMPEVFYYDDDLGLTLPWLIGSGFQAGFQHESNGRGGDNSRSTNYAYIQPSLIFRFTRQLHMLLAPKAWVYVRNDDETNGDLADYRGYFDLESRLGDPEGFALGSHYRRGRRGASWQFDLSYPLNQIPGFKELPDMYIQAQYYTGYSEELLEYNRKEDIFRLGFSLVR